MWFSFMVLVLNYNNPVLGVCEMTIFDRGRYKCLHDLFLKKYRSIVSIATAHILSVTVLAPQSLYSVQHDIQR